MIELIEQYRSELEDMCRRYHVKTLEVFGSAADGMFDPGRSDLDFLVDFRQLPRGGHARAYFGLLFALEDLFRRKIDLVEMPAVSNPFFLKSINQTRKVLYAA